MTRIFTDGAEMQDILFFDGSDSTTVTDSDPAPFASDYCYKMSNYAYKVIAAISECYIRQRIWIADDATRAFKLPNFRSGNVTVAYVGLDANGHIVVYQGSTLLETSSLVMNADQWYLMEIYFKLADAPNGRFVVYVDGTKVIDYTGDTKYSSYTTFDNIYWSRPSQMAGTLGLDDLALNDTAGGDDDSYCGDGVIIKQTPAGAGAHNNWHGSDGNDVDNWLLVDDFPNDGDTSYVYHDGSSSGTQEQYDLSDYDGTGKTILRIYPEVRARKTAAAAHTLKLGTLASGGADAMSAARTLTTSYARYVGNEQKVNPVDSGAWEEADIDALQIILEVG